MVNKVNHAIETLRIELYRIRGVLRKQRALSCEIMSAHPDGDHYSNAEMEILGAIRILEGKEDE